MPDPTPNDNCQAIRARYRVGQIIKCVLVEYRPFGMFVDLGDLNCLGLVELPMIEDRPTIMHSQPAAASSPNDVRPYPWYPACPAIGATVECVLIGFATLATGRAQPRLSMRRSDLETAQSADTPIP